MRARFRRIDTTKGFGALWEEIGGCGRRKTPCRCFAGDRAVWHAQAMLHWPQTVWDGRRSLLSRLRLSLRGEGGVTGRVRRRVGRRP